MPDDRFPELIAVLSSAVGITIDWLSVVTWWEFQSLGSYAWLY